MPDSSTLVDRVKIFVESSGTGPFQLGNALPSFRGSEALTDGLTYSYAVESGSDYEVGQGVYVLAVDQLIRAPTLSSNGGAPVAFPANVAVNFTALAADLTAGLAGSGTVTSIQGSGGTTGLTLTGGPITGAGTLTLGGTLGLANGGTGGTDEPTARAGVGLGNVDNTSDADKPISDATQTALDAKVATTALAAPSGAGMVGYQLDLPDTVPTTQAEVNRDRLSATGWIDDADLPHIRDRIGASVGTELQASFESIPAGATNYLPDGVYETTTALTSSVSTTIAGDPGRESQDNSWDARGGGTEIHYLGMTGDGLTISPPDLDVQRIAANLSDFFLRGSLSDGATAGNGIVLNGRTGHGQTFVKANIRNVNAGDFPERGFSLEGLVYGGKIDSIFAHQNGHNGFGTDAGGNNVGEMVFSRVRCFSNGDEGSTDQEKANFLWLAGSMVADMISASEGAGPGIILGSGPCLIGHAQTESNAGNQIVIGQPGNSAQAAILSALVAPGASYEGKCIHITEDTTRTILGNIFFGDSLAGAGTHITRDANAGQLVMLAAPRSASALMIDDNANTDIGYLTHAFCQVFARLSTSGTDVTGDGTDVDWKPDAEVLDVGGNFNPATGVFTATFSAVYDFEWAIPLEQLGAAHNISSVFVSATTYSRHYFVGNVGAMRDANNRYTIQGRARVPMVGGDTCKIVFNVGGGTKTVDTLGGGTYGFLSITTAH